MYKKKLMMIFAAGLSTLAANAQLTEATGFQNPESIVACGKNMYVSNLGAMLDPSAKDGDGYISLVQRADGKVLEQRFITGLNSPKGMKLCGNKLAIADVDRLVVYNVKTKKKLWEVDLSKTGTNYANDIVHVCGGYLITSTDKNAVYKVCRSGKVKQLKVKGDLPGANGIAKGCCKLFVANYGRGTNPDGNFGKLNRCNKKFKVLGGGGIYDGIVKMGHRLILSDWGSTTESQGQLIVYNLCKKKMVALSLGRTIDGPADIYADCKTKLLWIPAMRENKIVAISFKAIKQ